MGKDCELVRTMNRYRRPPFVDPQTNVHYDANNAEFSGWLTKQSAWLKDWRRRYFLLKGSKLFFAKTEYAAPHGMIDLAICTTVKSADMKARKKNSFEISTPDTTFLLYADTEKEKDDWIGSVGRSIVRCSNTYTREYDRADYDNDDDDDSVYSQDPNNPYFN